MSTSRRYVVIGAGAVGALLSAQLQLAGIGTVLVARGRNLEAIRAGGVRVRRPRVTDVVHVPVVGGPRELTLTPDDVLVLATKTQDAETVLAEWAWLPVEGGGAGAALGADLPILTFQNGLATEDLALRRFRRVYGVTIGVAASHLVPGEVVSPSEPVIGLAWLGRYPDRRDDAQAGYTADLVRAGYDVRSVADISAWKARKLLGNVGNGLGVLAGTRAEKDAAREILVAEARAVYAAAGIREPADPAPEWGRALTVEEVPGHVGGRHSTWQSFARGAVDERGVSSEVDHLNGEIVRLGRMHGVATPVNERLQRLLGAQARDREEPETHTVAELVAASLPDALVP
jgi:2-dehydropantoate 2-reductase